MALRSAGNTRRVSFFLVLAFVALPFSVSAQDRPAVALMPQAVALAQVQAPQLAPRVAPREWSSDRSLFVPLYASFAVLQALDVHSTRKALGNGGVEANPLMAGVAGNAAALAAVKAGGAAGVIFLTEKVRKRSRLGAIVLMAAVNSAYATVIANNYRVAGR